MKKTGFAVLAIALLSGCAWEITRDAEAVVLDGVGSAVNASDGEAKQFRVEAGAHLGAGNVIRTGSDEHLSVSLLPGALVELEPNSELRLVRLRITKNGNRVQEAMRRAIQVDLSRGSINVTVQFETESSPVELKTPHATIGVITPALFRISSDGEKTRVVCARGNLRITNAAKRSETALAAPAFQEFPSSSLEAVPAEFDAAATQEIENLQEVERKLLGLQYRSRLAPFPWRQ